MLFVVVIDNCSWMLDKCSNFGQKLPIIVIQNQPYRLYGSTNSCHEITGMDLDVLFILGTFSLLSVEGNNLQFKLLSLNVKGIRTFEKRKRIFNWLGKQNADIYFLQETYSTEESENQWRKQWRGDLFFAHGTSQSKGTLILIQEGLDFLIKSVQRDEMGTFIIVDALIQDSPFLLVNIYSPTKPCEQIQFLIKLHVS